MEQVRLGDDKGNITVSPVEAKVIDVAAVDFIWLADYDLPFNIKRETAGKLMVSLAKETDAQAKLIPFHEGWNPERVRKVFNDAGNELDGVIIAGR